MLRGRCSTCQASIPKTLFFYELGTLAVACLIYGSVSDVVLQFGLLLLFSFFLIIAAIDYEKKIIPDVLSYGVFWLGIFVLNHYGVEALPSGLASAVCSYILIKALQQFYLLVLKRDALGDADPLLVFATCVWLPFEWVPYFFIVAASLTIAWVWIHSRRQPSMWDMQIPFGPGLAVSGFGFIFYYTVQRVG